MASTTKRSWKLQEFVAHSGSVNCLALGHKSGRVMVSGGDDRKVNMWAVGKPNCIMSLSGHTSPIEAVRFGNAEEMVAAGSLSGALKIWDLEAAKIMRTLTGHKSSIRSLDFHPYGDFVASGSSDTNIKLWDIRRKGCIFTYKGHTKSVNSIRFSPDGRWIASAGEDGLLKLWDLTAGKLLQDFGHHDGPVTCIEFHPNEFLLATGSADRIVKFWDLESFQLVSSTDGNCTGIRSIAFHPEGLCLYAASQDMLKVYSWEPPQCLDSLPISWGKVADVAIAQNQLIGATYAQTNVSTYVADIQRIQPCGGTPVETPPVLSPPKSASGRRSFIVDRPSTQSTKQQHKSAPQEEPEESPSGQDDGADDQSFADIVDPDNYREVFKPRTKIDHSPTRNVEPFLPPEDDAATPTPVSVSQTKPIPAPSGPGNAQSTPVSSGPGTARPTPVLSGPGTARPSTTSTTQQSRPVSRPKSSTKVIAPAKEESKPKAAKSTSANKQSEPTPAPVISNNRNKPVDLNMDDFLPKQHQPSINRQSTPSNISEQETFSSILNGHDYMNKILQSRQRNIQIVRALWTSGSTKTAIDSALNMNDLPVIVDLLNILNSRPGLWSLDLSATLMPQIPDLLTSKYESYVDTGCTTLKIVLRNFSSVIKSNITAPPSIGVDITREERYNKCKACYKVLMNIRSSLDQKPHSGKLGSQVREIQLLMSQLD